MDIQRIIRGSLLFHTVNLVLTIILNNIYDWQGRYFMLGFVAYLLPNLIGLPLNIIIIFFVYKLFKVNILKNILLPIIFFSVNEICYAIIEKEVIFFGLFRTPSLPNSIPVDNIFYILTSSSAIVSAILVFYCLSLSRGACPTPH